MNDVSPHRTEDVSRNTTDVSRYTTDVTVDVSEAARRLGISEEAVRARIRRGKLPAEKVGALWQVHLPEGSLTAQPSVVHDTTGSSSAAQQTVTQHDTTDRHVVQHDTPPGMDLAPLAEVVRDQGRRIEELSAAAALWQSRAMHLEEQLKQLTATAGEAVEEPESVDANDKDAGVETEKMAAPEARGDLWERLMRWLRGT